MTLIDVLVIWNSQAGGSSEADALKATIVARPGFELVETNSGPEATQAARAAATREVPLVVAAGGDGTIHAVVEGLAAARHKPQMAILPLGTGNDLCRTLAIPLDPLAALALVHDRHTLAVDLLKAEADDWSTCFINMATGGSSGQVAQATSGEIKQRWGPLSYVRGAAEALPELLTYDVEARFDDEESQFYRAATVLVANGRTAAGGFELAPDAHPGDGLMDVIFLLEGTTVELAAAAMRFLLADYRESPLVLHRRARQLQLAATPAMPFSIDGDLYTASRLRFTVHPRALEVVVPREGTETAEPQ